MMWLIVGLLVAVIFFQFLLWGSIMSKLAEHDRGMAGIVNIVSGLTYSGKQWGDP